MLTAPAGRRCRRSQVPDTANPRAYRSGVFVIVGITAVALLLALIDRRRRDAQVSDVILARAASTCVGRNWLVVMVKTV
jgi:hypothetical protein